MSDHHLQLEPAAFERGYNRQPFKIQHRLTDHPLFALPRLVELAGSLEGSVLYFRADHAINQVDDDAMHGRTFVQRGLARPELSVADTVAQIERCNAWMQLRDVGKDPAYAALLRELMGELAELAEPLSPHITNPRADIFVSSPGATTPFHLDEEHNFLLQLRGNKRLAIADGSSREVLSEEDLRAFYQGRGELARYTERLDALSTHVELAPGEGVHIPPCYPHWVKNGPAVSVSLGILWHSELTAQKRYLHRANEWIRRAGGTPRSPGEQPLIDSLKVMPFLLQRRARRVLGAGRVRARAPHG